MRHAMVEALRARIRRLWALRGQGAQARRRRLRIPAILLAVVVAGGCASVPTPTPVPTLVPTPAAPSTASPAAAPPSTASPVAVPSPSEAPVGLVPGVLAVTVTDNLRVRSAPGTADESAIFSPLLPPGTQLVVTGGPVPASGYTWVRVAPLSAKLDGGADEGWVAIADRDGTPWVAAADDPTPGYEFARAEAPGTPVVPADAKAFASSVNAFGVGLYKAMLGDDGLGLTRHGVVMSPASVALALAMVRAGAGGRTGTEMDTVLRTDGWAALGRGAHALQGSLAAHDAAWTDEEGAPHALALRIANAAFAQRGWTIEHAYLDRIADAFGAGVGLVDYKADPTAAIDAINGWVSRQTVGKIPQLLGPADVDTTTRLTLVDAVYLKANWGAEFAVEHTAPRPFTRPDGSRVDVPTMTNVQNIERAKGDGWTATELPYAGANGDAPLAMTVIVPDDLVAFEKALTPKSLAGVQAAIARERKAVDKVTYATGSEGDCGTYPYDVELFLPRFKVGTTAHLIRALQALGMRDAFDGSAADFSGISATEPVHIGSVVHEATIAVDEKGTEAAAATAISADTGGCTGATPRKIVTLRVDRPFMYLLRDVDTGAILFMGRVLDPSAAN